MRDFCRRYIVYPIEALLAAIVCGFTALLPLDWASAIGGGVARAIGPSLARSRQAERNIALALPGSSPDEIRRIVRGMWDNFGRVIAEYAHIRRITRAGSGRIEIVGAENLAALQKTGTAGILFSGHLANWEIFALASHSLGVHYAQVYRAPNNPLIDWLIRRLRRLSPDDIVPKGASGARKALQILSRGRCLGMLVDQKMNDGIEVPFFGRPAMTPPALAQLALRFRCPVIPARMERLGGCRFRITIFPQLALPSSDNRQADVHAITARANELIEGWIRERPAEWLWLHRRWPEEPDPASSAARRGPDRAEAQID